MSDLEKLHIDCKILLRTLKQLVKNRGFTYAKIAEQMNVSEVTVKRWFSGKTCTLNHIFEICHVMGVSFFDVAELAKQEEEQTHFFTTEQESYFAKNLAIYGIFKLLYRGKGVAEVKDKWGIDSKKLFMILRPLEKLGLIEILSENQIQFKIQGNIRINHRGDLAKAILRPQNILFLDKVDTILENEDVCMQSAEVEFSQKSIEEFVEEINALGAKYRARAQRDKTLYDSDQLISARWLFAFAPYETDWRQYKLP